MAAVMLASALLPLLSACDKIAPTRKPAATAGTTAADPLAAHDPAPGTPARGAPEQGVGAIMQVQVVLDRLGFTPGVIDGHAGFSTRNALVGFQEANGLGRTGTLDDATRRALGRWAAIPSTRVVTIPADYAAGPFYRIPSDPADQARMPALGYVSLDEKLAERFHTTVDTLRALNPGAVAAIPASVPPSPSSSPAPSATTADANDAPFVPQPGPPAMFRSGQQVRVPNTGGDAIIPGAISDADWQRTLASLGIGSAQPRADHIVVSKSMGTLRVYDAAGTLVGMYTATMGSSHDPLPLGEWKVRGISKNPRFHYSPKLFWDASAGDAKAVLPAGPNGPVGVVWIDLDKPHYGIHGTPEPQSIGRAESHGCVRLTNWDAARLALMVRPGTRVTFAK